MKTPMQEHIEWLKEEIEAYALLLDVKKVEALTLAKEHAEELLEKEKEVIIQTSVNAYTAGYLDNQAKVDDSMNFPEEYYNETFNTNK